MKKLKVVELFAGVGGFRLGLEPAGTKSVGYEVVWSNQWEPSTKRQHACEVYIDKFGKENHSSVDIEKVIENDFDQIPDHDLLVGGFPCQDYSVARTLSQAKGLIGEKGVLWWSIYTILKRKGDNAPDYLMLENVDRLLKSPSSQRGRDFAVMLAGLADLGYAVEWRVINAAEYGMPQRRRRVFIMGYRKGTSMYDKIVGEEDKFKTISEDGAVPHEFPVLSELERTDEFEIKGKLPEVSDNFSSDKPKQSPFQNSGVMIDRKVWTAKTKPDYNGEKTTIKDIMLDEKEVPDEFFIDDKDMERWEYLKGAKKEERTAKSGHKYTYSEGAMIFPDKVSRPSRTIVTGEGGPTPSRFKHVVKTDSGKLRRLTPIELERLNMFPDNHTEGHTDSKRAFFMGNALVVGVIKKLGDALASVAS